MGREIERKFLVVGDAWREGAVGTLYRQGYLSRETGRTVRVRVAGDAAYLTIKGPVEGIARAEFEYPIPAEDVDALLELCDGPPIEKCRHIVPFGGLRWEVDEFLGANAGLVVAEIELESEDQEFARPPWLGREVSDDPRYFNSRLVEFPFSAWGPPAT
jgi:adenylate cyclase